MCAMHLCSYEAKWPNLELETQAEQLLGSLPLAFAFPVSERAVSISFERVIVVA